MLIAMATLLLWLGGYAVLCAARPFASCRRCRGAGEIERFKKLRTCPRCRGRKLRLRVGRRAHNHWRRAQEAGSH